MTPARAVTGAALAGPVTEVVGLPPPADAPRRHPPAPHLDRRSAWVITPLRLYRRPTHFGATRRLRTSAAPTGEPSPAMYPPAPHLGRRSAWVITPLRT